MARSAIESDLQNYLRQINEVSLLTPEEEKELGWLIINDSDHRAMLVSVNWWSRRPSRQELLKGSEDPWLSRL